METTCRKIVQGLVLAAEIIFLMALYFRPYPIVWGDDNRVVAVVQCTDGQRKYLDSYDEAAILSYLETCREQRNLFQNWNRHYRRDDIALEIWLHADGRPKRLYLGNFNYSDEGSGTVKWSVQSAGEVLAALNQILGL